MATTTPKGLVKPDTVTDLLSATPFNNNSDRIDTYGMGPYNCTSTSRPTGANLWTGMLIWETDTKLLREWDGSSWKTISPGALTSVVASLNIGSTGATSGGLIADRTLQFQVVDHICTWALNFSCGQGSNNGGAGSYILGGLPAAASGVNMLGSGYYYNGAFRTWICQNQGGGTMLMREGGGTNNTWGAAYAPIGDGNVGSFGGSYLV